MRRVFDVAGFAVHAVLEIYLKARRFAWLFNHFIDPCRAVALRRFVVFWQVVEDWDRWIEQFQMRGLRFFVVGEGKRDVCQPVEGQDAVGFWIVDGLVVVFGFGGLGVGSTQAN